MKSIYLCGFMGCGKSLIGKHTAALLDMPFIDLDCYIVSSEGMTIPEIFASKGESHFRDLESAYIGKLAGSSAVIATGGGAIVNPNNAALARQNGVVIFLDVDFETCYNRIKGDATRPLVQANTKAQLQKLYLDRKPAYMSNCDYSMNANGDPLAVAHRIKAYINSN